jgi:type I restriction enzyme S subunit
MSHLSVNQLPKGWAETKLAALVSPRTGKIQPQTIPEAPFIGMEQVEPHTMRLLRTIPAGSMKSAANAFEPLDVLYGRLRAYLNKVYQPEFAGLCSGEFIVLPESCAIHGRFLKYRLNAADFVSFASHINTGDRPRVDWDQVKPFSIQLPPMPEQERIADALDELLSDLDAGVAALEQIQVKLEHYRSALLKSAVDGTLTAEWRAQHPAIEPAPELLKRTLTERRRRWEDSQLQKFKDAGKSPPKDWKSKYKEPTPPDTSTLPRVSEKWTWSTPAQLGDVQLGRQRAPQHHSGAFMRPYLRVANVYEGRIDLKSVYEMNFTPEEFETFQLRYGDILLNEGQSLELVGRSAIYRDELPGACFTNTLVRFRPSVGIKAEFAQIYFTACLRSHRFRKLARWTTNIAHLGADRFAEIEIPLPPIAEQEAIVELVEDQLSVIDHLEADVETSLKSAQALRQSILRHAFEGKLVSQDPNEEPASELLKRITLEREQRAREILAAKKAKAKPKTARQKAAKP